MDLNGKNVVYIGGCGGIGSATCKLLVNKKVANLAVLDVVENVALIKELTTLNPLTKVFFLRIDICDRDNIKKCLTEVISKIKTIDVLINGSGVCNEFRAEIPIGVNLLGLINSCQIGLDLMKRPQGGGLVVNIASIAGLVGFPLTPIYSATKAGVITYTRAMADKVNFSKNGVSFICICPGITATNLCVQFTTETHSPNSKETLKLFNDAKQQTPEDCALNIVKAMELCKNGAAYLCDLGKMKEVEIPTFC
ncbi:development-specific 25 kDa protein-like [Eupeodes corollae]|uniref:development-specific 25 kDa protein-like n=1 Tax=Eupeodes corollae TaxID=290404 RepID=UPI00249263AA|nr:development-specific 25 kDa protein-like [Eupeodes corollae]